MKKAFTLLEVLIYVLVLAIIFSAIFLVFFLSLKLNNKAKSMILTIDSARIAMDAIISEIRAAESIYFPTSVFATTSGQLSLETKRYLPEGETSTFVDFYLCEKKLCFKKEGAFPIVLTPENIEINKMEFNLISANSLYHSIKINLQTSYKNPQNKPEFLSFVNLVSSVSLRPY